MSKEGLLPFRKGLNQQREALPELDIGHSLLVIGYSSFKTYFYRIGRTFAGPPSEVED
jgi:hypothetical protein